MLFRTAAVLIVIFWITMTGLLLRKEFSPGDDALREVPVSHVVKLLFHHQQPSDLQIFSEKLPLGHLRILPRVNAASDQRILDFSGNLKLTLPGLDRQRLTWSGTLEMDRLLVWQRLQLTVTLREPLPGGRTPPGAAARDLGGTVVELTMDAAAQQVHYETRRDERIVAEGDYALTPEGFQRWLRSMEIDPALLATVQGSSRNVPAFKARQSTLAIHDDHIDTYLVSAEQNGQTLCSFHVSQLGQILQARTLIGYTATPEDLLP